MNSLPFSLSKPLESPFIFKPKIKNVSINKFLLHSLMSSSQLHIFFLSLYFQHDWAAKMKSEANIFL